MPVFRLGRLAVDRTVQGRGLGGALCAPPIAAFASRRMSAASTCSSTPRTIAPRAGLKATALSTKIDASLVLPLATAADAVKRGTYRRLLRSPVMPTVAWFYGIGVAMYYNDHNPPHFHAQYGQSRAVIGIADGRIIAGSLPPTAMRLVTEWALAHRGQLEENWARARADEPLERIPGPDDD